MEFRRWAVAIRGLNSGATKWREYVDIADIKRRIESNGRDLIPLVMRLGWQKEKSDRIAILERLNGDGTEDE